MRDADSPVIGIGTVSIVPSASSSSTSPSTVMKRGSTPSVVCSKPAAGEPVTCGLTGNCRVWRSEKIGIVTRAVAGSSSDLRDRIADAVDRHELDVLVDIDARRLHDHRRPRGDHPRQDRSRPDHA